MCAGSLAEDRRSAVLFSEPDRYADRDRVLRFLYLCHGRGTGVILLGTAAQIDAAATCSLTPGGTL